MKRMKEPPAQRHTLRLARRFGTWGVMTVVFVVSMTLLLGGCGISLPLPWKKDTTTTEAVSTTALSADTPTEVTGTTRTTRTLAKQHLTPEAAVTAVAPAGWVLEVVAEQKNWAEVWAGPPQSEFDTVYIVRRGAGGWVVTEQALIGDEVGYYDDSLVGGPWREQDFPEIYQPGSGLFVEFHSGAYPNPAHAEYPQNNAGAQTVWLSLGEMLNKLKEGYITDATSYVTADFYRHFFFDFFNSGEPTSFNEFELTGWQEAGGNQFQVWANLYSSDAVSSFLRRAVFTGVSLPDNTGLMVWVDIWEPIEL